MQVNHFWITEKLGCCTGLAVEDALREDKEFTRVIDVGDRPIQVLHVHPECLYKFFSVTDRQTWIKKPVRSALLLLARGIGTRLLINSADINLSANLVYTTLRAMGLESEFVMSIMHRQMPGYTIPDRLERLITLFGMTFTDNRPRDGNRTRTRPNFVHPLEARFRVDYAKSLIRQRKERAQCLMILQKHFKVELWIAQSYYQKAKKLLTEEHAHNQNLTPEELKLKSFGEAVGFYEDIVRGEYPVQDRMRAQGCLDKLYDIEPKRNEKPVDDSTKVLIYIPDNKRLSNQSARKKIPDTEVIINEPMLAEDDGTE